MAHLKAPVLAVGLLLLASLSTLSSCTNADEVNAAFRQSRVSWYLFDSSEPSGLRSLAGFDQPTRTTWKPYNQSVRTTDFAALPDGTGAAAVSSLGLLTLEDRSGLLKTGRPEGRANFSLYRTGSLFLWDGKVFLTLHQEPPFLAPSATLAWWAPGQNRIALYPIPSQVRDPSLQAVEVVRPTADRPVLALRWKKESGESWEWSQTELSLRDGVEEAVDRPWSSEGRPLPPPDLAARIAERVGTGVPVFRGQGGGPALAFTAQGWVATASLSDAKVRLFRLPDLGPAGRYTGALFLSQGWVFSWETQARAYGGPAGLVHVPTRVLAP